MKWAHILFHFIGYSNVTYENKIDKLQDSKAFLCHILLGTPMWHLKLKSKDIQKKAQTQFGVYVQAAPLTMIYILNVELISSFLWHLSDHMQNSANNDQHNIDIMTISQILYNT